MRRIPGCILALTLAVALVGCAQSPPRMPDWQASSDSSQTAANLSHDSSCASGNLLSSALGDGATRQIERIPERIRDRSPYPHRCEIKNGERRGMHT